MDPFLSDNWSSQIHISDGQRANNCLLQDSLCPCNIKCSLSSTQYSYFIAHVSAHIPDEILLILLDLQVESQQSHRRLYSALSSSSHLVKNKYLDRIQLVAHCQWNFVLKLPVVSVIVTSLFGAVQAGWICSQKLAVDKHLLGQVARVTSNHSATNPCI